MAQVSKDPTKFSYTEYVQLPDDDGMRHEIIDGDHYVNPAPNTYHQDLSRRVQFQLFAQIELNELGRVYDAPTDLELADYDIVQPDLIVVMKDKLTIITPTKIKGIPDLVIEVLSNSTSVRDLGIKKQMYARNEVPEYWVVDPEEHFVQQFRLVEKSKFELVQTAKEMISFQYRDREFKVDLNKVW